MAGKSQAESRLKPHMQGHDMRRVYWFAALASMAITNHSVIADDTKQNADQSVYPLASHTQNPAFEYSARKVLGFVSEARVAIGNRNAEAATSYIDDAARELATIRSTRNYLEMMGVTFGRVVYGQGSSYYIPVADDTYAVRNYVHGPFWSRNKTLAVNDVELINVNIAINPENAMAQLYAARQDITDGKYHAADKALGDLMDESIRQTASTQNPFISLQDNIYLTRVLLRQENYDGARYTLEHARTALSEYETTAASPARHAEAEAMRQDIRALEETISQRNPTRLKQSLDKVEEWWSDLKDWAHDKVS